MTKTPKLNDQKCSKTGLPPAHRLSLDAPGLEDTGSGNAGGASSVPVNEVDKFGVDGVAQGFLHGGDCFGAGDAESSQESGLEAGCFHGG